VVFCRRNESEKQNRVIHYLTEVSSRKFTCVLKLFTPNFASFIRLSVSNLYKLRIRVNICANVTIISATLCNGFLVFRFENLTHNLLFAFFPFFMALYSPWIQHWASLNSSKFEFFSSRSSVLRYHISMSSFNVLYFKCRDGNELKSSVFGIYLSICSYLK